MLRSSVRVHLSLHSQGHLRPCTHFCAAQLRFGLGQVAVQANSTPRCNVTQTNSFVLFFFSVAYCRRKTRKNFHRSFQLYHTVVTPFYGHVYLREIRFHASTPAGLRHSTTSINPTHNMCSLWCYFRTACSSTVSKLPTQFNAFQGLPLRPNRRCQLVALTNSI